MAERMMMTVVKMMIITARYRMI